MTSRTTSSAGRPLRSCQDNYSFGWTSAAGFIAEFCAVGGKVVQRVFPPLNTTDYSTYAQQLKTDVDGTFVAVGGAGLIPFLKAYEQAHGPIDSKKFIGNLFWGTPGEFESLSNDVSGAYVGGAGTAGDLDTPAAKNYANKIIGKWFKQIPPGGAAAPQAASTFTFGYYINTWGLIKGLQAVKGDLSGGQKALQAALAKDVINGPYGVVKLDKNRQAILTTYYQQLLHQGRQAGGQDGRRGPGVDQTFGGTFSSTTPAPAGTAPKCVKRSLPWIGKETDPQGHLVARRQHADRPHPTDSAAPILRLRGVGRRYGGLHAVRDVDLDVAHGERRAILGPNGAGKTTLFNVISGDVAASSGTIEFLGEDADRLPAALPRQDRACRGRTRSRASSSA